jgi:hypothetical protein
VSLRAFNYSHTYDGLLEGLPNAMINDRILANAIADCERSQGKVHVIPPVVHFHHGPEHPTLPPILLWARLDCPVAVGLGSDGSDLVVVWFSDECQRESIEQIVFRAVQGLPWDDLAEGITW